MYVIHVSIVDIKRIAQVNMLLACVQALFAPLKERPK